MERNKGKLIPVAESCEEYCKNIGIATPEPYSSFREYILEEYWDKDIVVLGEKVYKVEWEVKGETECFDFADVNELGDGSIEFHTMHYNGGGSFEEAVYSELEKNR
jgi:hypothetical protein